jgi:hypothetical protein
VSTPPLAHPNRHLSAIYQSSDTVAGAAAATEERYTCRRRCNINRTAIRLRGISRRTQSLKDVVCIDVAVKVVEPPFTYEASVIGQSSVTVAKGRHTSRRRVSVPEPPFVCEASIVRYSRRTQPKSLRDIRVDAVNSFWTFTVIRTCFSSH